MPVLFSKCLSSGSVIPSWPTFATLLNSRAHSWKGLMRGMRWRVAILLSLFSLKHISSWSPDYSCSFQECPRIECGKKMERWERSSKSELVSDYLSSIWYCQSPELKPLKWLELQHLLKELRWLLTELSNHYNVCIRACVHVCAVACLSHIHGSKQHKQQKL